MKITFICYMLNNKNEQSKHLISVPFVRDHYTTEQSAARLAEDSTGLVFDWMEYAK